MMEREEIQSCKLWIREPNGDGNKSNARYQMEMARMMTKKKVQI